MGAVVSFLAEMDGTFFRVKFRFAILHNDADPHIGVQHMLGAVNLGHLLFALDAV